jgi:predicted PurR-regulated permease PerM
MVLLMGWFMKNKKLETRPAQPPAGIRELQPYSPSSVGPHIWQIRAVRDLFWITLVVLIIWLGYYLRSIFTPVLISLFLAYLVNPLINWMSARWNMPRPLAISLILFIVLLVAAIFWVWFGPLLAQQIITLANKVPQYIKTAA